MKISLKHLKKMIKEELSILENEEQFNPSISQEQFGHIKSLLTFDFKQGLMFLQSGLDLSGVAEEQKKELAKTIWDESAGYKDDPDYVREIERKKVSIHHGDHKGVEFHKKKLAAMDMEHQDNMEAVGKMMGLSDPYHDMMSIAHRGKFSFEYFYDQLKQKGIL